jgi:hypothetical protein
VVDYRYGGNSILEFLHFVDVVAVTIVLEVHAVSIFKIEVYKVGEFWCIRILFLKRGEEKGKGMHTVVLSGPVGTVCL